MTYTGFRFTGRNATVTRPDDRSQAVAGATWAKDASSKTADDGTELDATWANRLRAALEALVTGLGGNLADGDNQLKNAVIAYVTARLSALDVATVDGLADALALKAPLASPALTGTPTAPTATLGTNTMQLATTAFVQAAVAALVGASPALLDTLDELAAALGDDANFATTVTNALAAKQPLDSDLTAIAALSTTTFGRALLTLADAAAARSTLGLVIGTDVQAYSSALAAWAAYTPGASFTMDATALLRWGGTTSSFPAFKRSSTAMQVRLADDSAFAPFVTGNLTVNGQATIPLQTLTDAANVDWNCNNGGKAKVTLGGNRTINAVTNAIEGSTYLLWVIQDATGSRTLTWTTSGGGSFDFGTDGAPTLTTTASKADLLAFEAISIGGTLKLRFCGIKKGFG